MKTALITGVNGQDGSYLAEMLLSEGYDVHGTYRRKSTPDLSRIDHIADWLTLHRCDVGDYTSVERVITSVMPTELYHEADMDHVSWSYSTPLYCYDITALGAARVLEAVAKVSPSTRVFQPLSSNMYTSSSPYACAKRFVHELVQYHRKMGLWVCGGILFNHESPRRSPEYVTRKITRAAAHGQRITLGDTSIEIDWSFAGDCMEAALQIMQLPDPQDFEIGSGVLHSIDDFARMAYEHVGLDYKNYIETSDQFKRPLATGPLRADIKPIQAATDWSPAVNLRSLIQMMVEAE